MGKTKEEKDVKLDEIYGGEQIGKSGGKMKILFNPHCSHFGVKGFKNGCKSVMDDKRVSMNAKHHKDSLGQVCHHYFGVSSSFGVFCFSSLDLWMSLFYNLTSFKILPRRLKDSLTFVKYLDRSNKKSKTGGEELICLF